MKRRGHAIREPRAADPDVDWRTERDAGLRLGQRIEDASRSSRVLASLSDAAEKAHGRAGPITAARCHAALRHAAARGKSSRGTSSAASAARDGVRKLRATPLTAITP